MNIKLKDIQRFEKNRCANPLLMGIGNWTDRMDQWGKTSFSESGLDIVYNHS